MAYKDLTIIYMIKSTFCSLGLNSNQFIGIDQRKRLAGGQSTKAKGARLASVLKRLVLDF